MKTSISDVADEDNLFSTQADNDDEMDEHTLERKEQFRINARQWVKNEEPQSFKTSVKEFTKIDGNTTSYSTNGIKANAPIRVEQDFDLVLWNMKLKKLGQPHEEVLSANYNRPTIQTLQGKWRPHKS